jgi:hypothetical protein
MSIESRNQGGGETQIEYIRGDLEGKYNTSILGVSSTNKMPRAAPPVWPRAPCQCDNFLPGPPYSHFPSTALSRTTDNPEVYPKHAEFPEFPLSPRKA